MIRKRVFSEHQDGGCNFCTRRDVTEIIEIGSSDPMRNLVVRFCGICFDEVKEEIPNPPKKAPKKRLVVYKNRKKHGACCNQEDRTWGGGCKSCGDPSF